MSSRFSARGSEREIETGNIFMPKFDEHGLVSCIVTDAKDGEVLMFAHMNEESLARTIESGEAWFWSRSRKQLWRKGETSGNTLTVEDIRVDCDQDAVWLRVEQEGGGRHGLRPGRRRRQLRSPSRIASLPNRNIRPMSVVAATRNGPVNSARNNRWSYLRCM